MKFYKYRSKLSILSIIIHYKTHTFVHYSRKNEKRICNVNDIETKCNEAATLAFFSYRSETNLAYSKNVKDRSDVKRTLLIQELTSYKDRSEPTYAYSRYKKDRSEANYAYSIQKKDQSELNSAYSRTLKDRSEVTSSYSRYKKD